MLRGNILRGLNFTPIIDWSSVFLHNILRYKWNNRLLHICNRLVPNALWKIWNITTPFHCTCSWNLLQNIAIKLWLFSKHSHSFKKHLVMYWYKEMVHITFHLFHMNFQKFHLLIFKTLRIFYCIVFKYQRKNSSDLEHLEIIFCWIILLERKEVRIWEIV